MRQSNNFLCLALIAFVFLSGCASTYKNINPVSLNYKPATDENGIKIEYQSNLLNGKYAKNESKSGVALIAVKITNNSEKTIIPQRNIKIFTGEKEVSPTGLNSFYSITEQNPDKSLKFLFLLPLNVYTFSQTTYGNQVTSEKHKFYPVGLILAPPLAFGNMAAAKKANKKYMKELQDNNIWERIIPAGKTAYGLVGIREPLTTPLAFKVNTN